MASGSVFGGDINEVSWSNTDVLKGSGFFFPMAGEDNTFEPGGLRNQSGSKIDGAGRMIITKNQMTGSFEIVVSNDMRKTKELETAQALHAALSDTTWTIALNNGVTYKGVGAIVGELKVATNASTFTLTVESAGFVQI